MMLGGGDVQAAQSAASDPGFATGLGYLGAALSYPICPVSAAVLPWPSAASAALGQSAKDSSVLGKSLIFVGLAEGVCLYGLIISFMILGNL